MVEILQEEAQAADSQDREVKFAQEDAFLVGFKVGVGVPYERTELAVSESKLGCLSNQTYILENFWCHLERLVAGRTTVKMAY